MSELRQQLNLHAPPANVHNNYFLNVRVGGAGAGDRRELSTQAAGKF